MFGAMAFLRVIIGHSTSGPGGLPVRITVRILASYEQDEQVRNKFLSAGVRTVTKRRPYVQLL